MPTPMTMRGDVTLTARYLAFARSPAGLIVTLAAAGKTWAGGTLTNHPRRPDDWTRKERAIPTGARPYE